MLGSYQKHGMKMPTALRRQTRVFLVPANGRTMQFAFLLQNLQHRSIEFKSHFLVAALGIYRYDMFRICFVKLQPRAAVPHEHRRLERSQARAPIRQAQGRLCGPTSVLIFDIPA